MSNINDRCIASTLKHPIYVNVYKARDDRWYPVWDSNYYGAYKRRDAVRLRCIFLSKIRNVNTWWNETRVRTIRISGDQIQL